VRVLNVHHYSVGGLIPGLVGEVLGAAPPLLLPPPSLGPPGGGVEAVIGTLELL
jgi:hypothetical protein